MSLIYDSTETYDSIYFYDTGTPAPGTVFTPPLVRDRPTFLPDSTPAQRDLWRHFENRLRGVNVWIMSDGSVVQDTATPENSNTNMTGVYPWNPDAPSAPYVTAIYILPGANPQVPTAQTTSHSVYPVAFFAGASSYPITPAQATLLTDYTVFGDGYADCIT